MTKRIVFLLSTAAGLLGATATTFAGAISGTVYTGVGSATGDGTPFSNPVLSFTTDTIDYPDVFALYNASDFGVQFKGTFDASVEQDYSVTVRSDDGAILYVDGIAVVDNGGAHPPAETTGMFHLTAGPHDFTLNYFECCGGPAELRVTIPAGLNILAIPDSGASLLFLGISGLLLPLWRRWAVRS